MLLQVTLRPSILVEVEEHHIHLDRPVGMVELDRIPAEVVAVRILQDRPVAVDHTVEEVVHHSPAVVRRKEVELADRTAVEVVRRNPAAVHHKKAADHNRLEVLQLERYSSRLGYHKKDQSHPSRA